MAKARSGGKRRAGSPTSRSEEIAHLMSRKIVGQPGALQYIVPYVEMYEAGLSPPNRPAGVFLLLGPTGTGKTRTVEALAEVLHGSSKAIVRVDCGEYQADHEVAKLIGAPPGYLGHRETKPLLTEERLKSVTSSDWDMSIVLFDEIEKAAPTLTTLLLGILDRATLKLGDNTEVNFEKSLVFLTSNLGAREMNKQLRPDIGFRSGENVGTEELLGKLQSIGLAAVRRRFSPEFVNRIDVVVTYQPLDRTALASILDQHLEELQHHVNTRLGERSFTVEVSQEAREFLLGKGTSPEYGARELKRTLHRFLSQPLAALVAGGQVAAGSKITVSLNKDKDGLTLNAGERPARAARKRRTEPMVLVLDDHPDLLSWLDQVLITAGFRTEKAATLEEARRKTVRQVPDLAVLDLMLPDGDGLSLALELRGRAPKIQVILMTGMMLSPEEAAVCRSQDIPVLRKPFLGQEVVSLLRARMLKSPPARGVSSA